jgi:hypothetical protein
MQRFSSSQSQDSIRTELLAAIHRSGAFRSFKNAARRLGVEGQWFAF